MPARRRPDARATSTPSPTRYDPALAPGRRRRPRPPTSGRGCARCTSQRAPLFLQPRCRARPATASRFVAHHVAHAASAYLAVAATRPAPCSCSTAAASAPRTWPAATPRTARSRCSPPRRCRTRSGCSTRSSPRTSASAARRDEYKVMAMASYGRPALPRRRCASSCARDRRRRLRHRAASTGRVRPAAAHGRRTLDAGATPTSPPACRRGWRRSCSTSPRWLHERTGERALDDGRRRRAQLRRQLAAAGARGRSSEVWVQPAVGRRRHRARRRAARRRRARRPRRADAHRGARAAAGRRRAGRLAATRRRRPTSGRTTSPRRSPRCSPPTASSRGSRAAASTARARSGTAACSPTRGDREPRAAQRRQGPRAVPAGRADGAAERARGDLRRAAPEPVHALHPRRARRRGASASRPSSTSTAPRACRPSTARTSRSWRAMLERFEERTGVPVVVNTSLNTAGRPMVDDPRDALECFGSAPVDLLAIGPFVVRRAGGRRGRAARPRRRRA